MINEEKQDVRIIYPNLPDDYQERSYKPEPPDKKPVIPPPPPPKAPKEDTPKKSKK